MESKPLIDELDLNYVEREELRAANLADPEPLAEDELYGPEVTDAEVEAFQEAEFGVTRADLNWLEDLSQNPGAPSGRPVRDFTNEQLDQLEMKVEQVEAEEFVVPEAMVNVPAGEAMELTPLVQNPLTDGVVRDMEYYGQLEWTLAEREGGMALRELAEQEAGMAVREVELGELMEIGGGEAGALYEQGMDAAGLIPMGLNPLLDYSEWDPKYQHQKELVDWFNGIQLAISDTYDRTWVWYLVDNKWYRGSHNISVLGTRSRFLV